jgi:hypothetical protein
MAGSISVFPNPVKPAESISIQVAAFKNKLVKIGLTDITGRRMTLVNVRPDNNGRAILATGQSLLPGVYLLEVYSEGLQYESRVSIMSK